MWSHPPPQLLSNANKTTQSAWRSRKRAQEPLKGAHLTGVSGPLDQRLEGREVFREQVGIRVAEIAARLRLRDQLRGDAATRRVLDRLDHELEHPDLRKLALRHAYPLGE